MLRFCPSILLLPLIWRCHGSFDGEKDLQSMPEAEDAVADEICQRCWVDHVRVEAVDGSAPGCTRIQVHVLD
jgi:hypothetical protein